MESASSFPHRMATMCRDNLTRRTTSLQSKKLLLQKEQIVYNFKETQPFVKRNRLLLNASIIWNTFVYIFN